MTDSNGNKGDKLQVSHTAFSFHILVIVSFHTHMLKCGRSVYIYIIVVDILQYILYAVIDRPTVAHSEMFSG